MVGGDYYFYICGMEIWKGRDVCQPIIYGAEWHVKIGKRIILKREAFKSQLRFRGRHNILGSHYILIYFN